MQHVPTRDIPRQTRGDQLQQMPYRRHIRGQYVTLFVVSIEQLPARERLPGVWSREIHHRHGVYYMRYMSHKHLELRGDGCMQRVSCVVSKSWRQWPYRMYLFPGLIPILSPEQ